ncbi:hypothetical protein [Actinoplanes sp. NPDC051411]|uniref:hypothetical protein n=1 Tax=Actinoplanes sp. NPDC051411 TaxID=3155522 RepID=UPI0034131B13
MPHEYRVFRNPPPATSADVDAALGCGDLSAALDAMVGTALYERGDWHEPQELYLRLLEHDDRQVSALAATCLGHLARVHRQLDEARGGGRAAPETAGSAHRRDSRRRVGGYRDLGRARWRRRLWNAVRRR